MAASSPMNLNHPKHWSGDLIKEERFHVNERVLVVEDNEDLVQLITRQLRLFSFQVSVARHSADAVAMALSHHPDVILMDVVIPNKMDGLEALSQIRANPKTRGIPIVALNPEYLQFGEKAAGQKASTMNLRVLVAEDHPDLLDLLSRQLRFCGYQVETAKNGAEAVATAVSDHPDVILMDIVMPKMDGFEAVFQIRGNPKTRDIPVLALTAWLSPNSRQNYMARGFNDCLSKPFTHEDLHRAIDRLLRDTVKRSEPSDLPAYLPDRPN